MRALAIACLLVLAASVALAKRGSHVKVPKHVRKTLEHAHKNHERYYPDFKYEGWEGDVHSHVQPKANLHRRGTGPHDVYLKNSSSSGRGVQNIHMANKTAPYPKNVQWLLNMFEQGYGIPRSYNDILPNGDVYWGTQTYLSVGAFNEYGQATELDSMIAIQERTLTRFGLNLYDAAVWQISLSLWWLAGVPQIYEANILYAGTTGPAGTDHGNPGGITNIRADASVFLYGPQKVPGNELKKITYPGNVTHFPSKAGKAGKPVKQGPGSFFFRMIGPRYQMTDPMNGHYGNAWKYPWPNYDSTTPWNTFGIIHFNDWKPITGENVWANMLGPIQSLGLQTKNNLTNTSCGNEFLARHHHLPCDFKKFETTPPAIQLGISIIPALLALQSEMGTLFHCPWGSKIFPPDPDEGQNVSNENNFSGYASIDTFYWALENYTKGTSDSTLTWAKMSASKLREGLKKWFSNDQILSAKGQLPNDWRVMPQGGHVNSSGYFPVPLNTVGGLAIDCQTWGMAVMGRAHLDDKYGVGTAYNIWQTAKKYAGYYKGSVLSGVGYTDLANKTNHSSIPVNTIWSAEWTFGAINMAQILAADYKAIGHTDKYESLLADAQSMYNQVTMLWPQGLRFPDGSYVYANKRFFIPWGWFSNPISALCSTGWSVMMALNFDPFHYGGGYKIPLVTPPHLLEEADDEYW